MDASVIPVRLHPRLKKKKMYSKRGRVPLIPHAKIKNVLLEILKRTKQHSKEIYLKLDLN